MGTMLLKTDIRTKGGTIKRSFDRATKVPEITQGKLLSDILKCNQKTQYGEEHAFSRISDAGTFSRAVPICSFSDLAQYVEKMKNAEKNILTADQPFMFNLTSGTTDKPKYVPITQGGMKLTANTSYQWLCRALRDHPSFLNHSILFVAGAPVEGQTRSGIPYGSASGMMCQALPDVLHPSYALPFALAKIKDYDLRYYVIARIALENEVSFVLTPNPGTLIRIAETGIQHQEDIVRSIRDGVMCSAWPLERTPEDSAILDIVGGSLRPNPARARMLQQVIGRHGGLMPFACWKKLKLIGCWLGGSIGFQADKLSAYFGRDVPRRDIGYIASEGVMTIPYEDESPAGILALENHYYEFIPDGESVEAYAQVLKCHELEMGKQYRIILTSVNGLYRYDIHDTIEVCGFYNRTPVIAFVRKSDDMLNITGEKLHVNHFLEAFRRIKIRHDLSVVQACIVPNYKDLRHEILLRLNSSQSNEFLLDIILPLIDKVLSEVNIEYDARRKSRRLNPPCLHMMDESWADDVRGHFLKNQRADIQYKWRMLAEKITDVDARHIQYTVAE